MSIDVIEAREEMMLIRAFSYSKMSKSDRSELWDSLSQKTSFLNEKIESDDMFAQMLGM